MYEKYQCIPKLSLLVKPIVKRNQRADIMMINGQKLKRLTGSITMLYSWAVHCCLLNARNWWSFSRQSCTKVMAGTKENLHNSAYILGDLPFPPNSGIVKTSKLPVMCCFVFFSRALQTSTYVDSRCLMRLWFASIARDHKCLLPGGWMESWRHGRMDVSFRTWLKFLFVLY